jgi:hypothetical protein
VYQSGAAPVGQGKSLTATSQRKTPPMALLTSTMISSRHLTGLILRRFKSGTMMA